MSISVAREHVCCLVRRDEWSQAVTGAVGRVEVVPLWSHAQWQMLKNSIASLLHSQNLIWNVMNSITFLFALASIYTTDDRPRCATRGASMQELRASLLKLRSADVIRIHLVVPGASSLHRMRRRLTLFLTFPLHSMQTLRILAKHFSRHSRCPLPRIRSCSQSPDRKRPDA